MQPSTYTKLAMRTETNQINARRRLVGLEKGDKDNLPELDNLDLKPIRLCQAVLGLTGEVGELASALEKTYYYNRDKPIDRVNIAEEVGDCLWYLAQICDIFGFDMSTLMQANINKLMVRFPEKFDDKLAQDHMRDLENERRALLIEQSLVEGQINNLFEIESGGED